MLKAHVLDFTEHNQSIQPRFVLLQLGMAVACHRSVVKSCNYRLSSKCATWFKLPCCHIRENKKSEVSKDRASLLRDREPCAGCHYYAVFVDLSRELSTTFSSPSKPINKRKPKHIHKDLVLKNSAGCESVFLHLHSFNELNC